MLVEAAAARDIDLARSWMIGDILDDVEAGNRAGCQTVLVDLGTEMCPDHPGRWPRMIARSTADALRYIAVAEDLLPVSSAPLQVVPRAWYSAAAAVH
jgi:D-glycero-D-manno-heptose 1,7-bisphosphate phosphatase